MNTDVKFYYLKERHTARAEAEESGVWGWRVWIGNTCIQTMLPEEVAHGVAANINRALGLAEVPSGLEYMRTKAVQVCMSDGWAWDGREWTRAPKEVAPNE